MNSWPSKAIGHSPVNGRARMASKSVVFTRRRCGASTSPVRRRARPPTGAVWWTRPSRSMTVVLPQGPSAHSPPWTVTVTSGPGDGISEATAGSTDKPPRPRQERRGPPRVGCSSAWPGDDAGRLRVPLDNVVGAPHDHFPDSDASPGRGTCAARLSSTEGEIQPRSGCLSRQTVHPTHIRASNVAWLRLVRRYVHHTHLEASGPRDAIPGAGPTYHPAHARPAQPARPRRRRDAREPRRDGRPRRRPAGAPGRRSRAAAPAATTAPSSATANAASSRSASGSIDSWTRAPRSSS